jgi:endo-1,3(4)-beta-glucanase
MSLIKKWFIIVFIICAIVGFIFFTIGKNAGIKSEESINNPLLQKMLHKALVVNGPYINNGVIPPTNQWFSSFAFHQPSQPVYAYPLAVQATETGLGVAVPQIRSSADLIESGYQQQLAILLDGFIAQKIRSYDALSVELEHTESKQTVMHSRITQGSPFLFISLMPNRQITFKPDGFKLKQIGNSQWIYSRGNIRFGIFIDSSSVNASNSGGQLTYKNAQEQTKIAVFALPKNAKETEYFSAAKNPISSTSIASKRSGNLFETTVSIKTNEDTATLFGLIPNHKPIENQENFGQFDTIYGHQTIYKGMKFNFTTPLEIPATELPIENLNPTERDIVVDLIRKDADSLEFTKTDSYFAGKELYRAAQLLQLAKQLEAEESADKIQEKLVTELSMWFDPEGYKKRQDKFFYYDNKLKGLVAQTPSFGSEKFNDHHFHYGYFISAASIASRYDPDFLNQHKNFIDLIIKDIANTNHKDKDFPVLRHFDEYTGHSWAAGFAEFEAGQNQESSSEAAHAWYAIYYWSKITQNDQQQEEALWLFSRETQAARTHWLEIDKNSFIYDNYAHQIVSLVWNGKMEYATFFDNNPESKLAIQLIPVFPGSTYLGHNKGRIKKNIEAIYSEKKARNFSKFKDYLLMYQALYNPKVVEAELSHTSVDQIDDANSLSYLYAWVYTRN